MPRDRPARTAIAAMAAALMGALALTGCGSFEQERVEPGPRPDVEWRNGEPAGPLEDDPWVRRVRAADLELKIAGVTRDFGAPELYDDLYEYQYGVDPLHTYLLDLQLNARRGAWFSPAGPAPMIPIHVAVDADGQGATVTMCLATGWYVSAESPRPPADPVGTFTEQDVKITDGRTSFAIPREIEAKHAIDMLGAGVVAPFLEGIDGPQEVEDRFEDIERSGTRRCLLDDAAIGLFTPQPDASLTYGVEDIWTLSDRPPGG